jgi:hypothetical protein
MLYQRARISLNSGTYAVLMLVACSSSDAVSAAYMPRIDHVHKARETNDYQHSPLSETYAI